MSIFQSEQVIKYREGTWNSLLKRLKCWRKSCSKFDSLLSRPIQDVTACSLGKMNFNAQFKVLYLLNCICYFNTICRIYGQNSHL